jgi:hypothetical protein
MQNYQVPRRLVESMAILMSLSLMNLNLNQPTMNNPFSLLVCIKT